MNKERIMLKFSESKSKKASKVVAFDLDNTLLDVDASLLSFLKGQYERLLSIYSNTSFSQSKVLISDTNASDVDATDSNIESAMRSTHFSELLFIDRFISLNQNGHVPKEIIYGHIVAEFNLPEETHALLLLDYQENFRNSCIGVAGLHETLEDLKNLGCTLAIITNGNYPFQLYNIQGLGIEHLFSSIIVSEKVGSNKPHQLIFNSMLKEINVDAENVIFVGDNPNSDVAGAKNAGLSAVWKKTKLFDSAPLADHIISELTELPEIVSRLFFSGNEKSQLRKISLKELHAKIKSKEVINEVSLRGFTTHDLLARDSEGLNAMHLACKVENNIAFHVLKNYFLAQEQLCQLLISQDTTDRTVIHYVAESKWNTLTPKFFKELLHHLGDRTSEALMLTDSDGKSPLHYVAINEYGKWTPELVSELLAQLGNQASEALMLTDNYGRTPLHYVANNSGGKWTPEHFSQLLAHLGDRANEALMLTDSSGNAPLHYVAKNEYGKWTPELFIALLAQLGDRASEALMQPDKKSGMTPLHYIASKRNKKWTPEHFSELLAQLGDRASEALMLTDCDGNTPLHYVASNDWCRWTLQHFSELLAHLGDRISEALMLANSDGNTLLHHVAKDDANKLTPELFSELLAQLGDRASEALMQPDKKSGMTPLHYIASKRNKKWTPEYFSELLAQLGDRASEALMLTDSDGNTPLHYVVRRYTGVLAPNFFGGGRLPEFFSGLLAHLGDRVSEALMLIDSDGRTPLHDVARMQGDKWAHELFSELLAQLGNRASETLMQPDKKSGMTPLHHVTGGKWTPEHFSELLAHLGDRASEALMLTDSDGKTPLHNVAENNNGKWTPELFIELLAQLGDRASEALMQPDKRGTTPLHDVALNQYGKWAPELFSELLAQLGDRASEALMLRPRFSKYGLRDGLIYDFDLDNGYGSSSRHEVRTKTNSDTPLHLVAKNASGCWTDQTVNLLLTTLGSQADIIFSLKDNSGITPIEYLLQWDKKENAESAKQFAQACCANSEGNDNPWDGMRYLLKNTIVTPQKIVSVLWCAEDLFLGIKQAVTDTLIEKKIINEGVKLQASTLNELVETVKRLSKMRRTARIFGQPSRMGASVVEQSEKDSSSEAGFVSKLRHTVETLDQSSGSDAISETDSGNGCANSTATVGALLTEARTDKLLIDNSEIKQSETLIKQGNSFFCASSRSALLFSQMPLDCKKIIVSFEEGKDADPSISRHCFDSPLSTI